MQNNDVGIYRRNEVLRVTGLGDNTIRRLIERGEFPRPIQLAPRVIGWRRAEVHAWIDSRRVATLPPVGKSKRRAA